MCSINILFIFLVSALISSSEALRILGVFPFTSKSHFVMGKELFKILAQNGHKVDVISHFPQKKPVPNYTDISLAGSMPSIYNNVTISTAQEIADFSAKMFIKRFGMPTCNLLGNSRIQEFLKKPKNSYDVVIVEIFAAQCWLGIGSYFNAPMVGVVTMKLHDWLYAPFGNPFNTAYIGSLFSGYSQEMNFFERLKNTYFAITTIYPFFYHIEMQRDFVEKYFGRKISSMQELYDDVAILLVNSHHSLNDIKPATPDIIEVGGLHIAGTGQELSPELEKWLNDSEEGCVYISFGSMVKIETLPADKLEVFYETFRNIEPVRVLMKISDEKLLPAGLPKNVKISSWLPQVAVLKHKNTKAFVTHGGLMGTQESIAWGVPLIGFPIFGDQLININSYVNKKIAVSLDLKTFDADEFTNAVNTVMKDPEYKINTKKAAELFLDRPMTAKDTAIYWVEFAARHGTRLKSPATKLTWYQYYLLDVYGFILGNIFLILYIVKKISRITWVLYRKYKDVNRNSKFASTSRKNK